MAQAEWHRTSVVLVLRWFILASFAVVWCPTSRHKDGLPYDISEDDETARLQKTDLEAMKGRLVERDRQLKQMITQLRQKYPEEVASFMKLNAQDTPTIYAVTPTHTRPEQKAELTRLCQAFLHVPKFHWIVVEDYSRHTELVSNFLRTCGLPYTHLYAVTPPQYKLQDDDPNWLKPRGVLQRNRALEWIRSELNPNEDAGVVYFADDDNTYSLQLFEEVGWNKMLASGGMVSVLLCGGKRRGCCN